MRWCDPVIGGERVRTAFLLLPKRIGDETRWLETATWVEEWMGPGHWWVGRRWVD